jgi:hypothetical protein
MANLWLEQSNHALFYFWGFDRQLPAFVFGNLCFIKWTAKPIKMQYLNLRIICFVPAGRT